MLKSKLENLFNRFNKKHYYSLAGILLLVVIGVFFVVTPAQALVEEVANGMIRFASWLFLGLARLAIGFTIFALEFFIKVAQYNNYVDAPTVLVGWVMVRDVANMFFVIALLLIAFGTMMGMENYMWTKTLVKLILAAVFINFSNLICGIFIDIAHVFTITFVNAIAGAAGGNVIKMLHLQEVLTMVGETGDYGGDLQLDVLISAIAGFIFAAISAATMIAYLVVMVARLVVLWVLIVLSPLAFALQTIPQTEQYAKEWWQKFGKQVIVAPVMVFFLWLAFATVGAGNIATQQALAPGAENLADVQKVMGTEVNQPKLSLSSATTWDNMANFLIPIALLIVGLNVVQQIGVVGGGMVGGVVNFGKKVATIASGYAAGRWLAGAAGKGLKAAAWHAPVIGGEKWQLAGQNAWEHIKSAYYGKAAGLSKKGLEKEQDLVDKTSQLENVRLRKETAKTPEERVTLEKEEKSLSEEVDSLEKEVMAESGKAGGVIGWFARRSIAQKKQYGKAKAQAEVRQKIAFKRVGSESGGWIFNRLKNQVEAQDRIEKGILEAEEMRGKAKDEQFMNKGRVGTLVSPRRKWGGPGIMEGFRMRQGESKESVLDEITSRKRRAGTIENIQKALQAGAEFRIDVKARVETEAVRAQQATNRATVMTPAEKKLNEREAKAKAVRDEAVAAIEAEYNPKIKEAQEALESPALDYNILVMRMEKELRDYRESDKYRTDLGVQSERRDNLKKQRANLQVELERDLEGARSSLVEDVEALEPLKKERERARALVAETPEGEDKEAAKILYEETNKKLTAAETIIEEKKKTIDKKAKEGSEQLEELDRQISMTDEEARLSLAVDKARQAREEDPEYKRRKGMLDTVIDKKQQGLRIAEEPVKAVGEDRIRYFKSEDFVVDKNSPEYLAAQAVVDEENKRLETTLKSRLGIGGVMAAQRTQLSETAAKAAKAQLEGTALQLEGLDAIFRSNQLQDLFAQAGEKIKEKIKEVQLQDIFTEGAGKLETALAKLKKGVKMEVILKDLEHDAGALYTFVEHVAAYTKDRGSDTAKQTAKDNAESLWSYERTGNDTPASAFKRSVKKQMEDYEGIEKERAASRAADAVRRLFFMKSRGQKLDYDQQAELMASAHFLVKNGWSDDMLGRLVDMVREKDEGKITDPRQKEETEYLEHLLLTELGWGRRDEQGKLQIINESSEKRTNDLHRLMSKDGDVGGLHSENAVLLHQRVMKNQGVNLEIDEAAKSLAEQIQQAGDDLTGLTNKYALAGEALGWDTNRIQRQLENFATNFVKKGRSAEEAMHEFEKSLSKTGQQQEFLTEMKAYALKTTHLDDAGHTIFNMRKGYAHGLLSDDAMKNMLSDWVKVSAMQRMSGLKSHALGYMDEVNGTLHRLDLARVAATFQGVDSKTKIENMDARVVRQLLKHGALEDFERDATGAFVVGAEKSVLLSKKFRGNTEEAMRDVARDWSVMLQRAPKILLAHLAMAGGLSSEAGMNGNLRLNLFGENIKRVEDLVEWVNKHIDDGSGIDVGDATDRRDFRPLKSEGIVSGATRGKDKSEDESEEETGT